MMNLDTWKNNIISSLQIFADVEKQRIIWVEGNAKIFSSWEEAYCELFDDFDLNGFIDIHCNENSTVISKETSESITEFRSALINFGDKPGDFIDPKSILIDPEWHRVCALASKALRLLV